MFSNSESRQLSQVPHASLLQFVSKINNHDFRGAFIDLEQISLCNPEALGTYAEGIKNETWQNLPQVFKQGSFILDNGEIFVVGPYRNRRIAADNTAVLAIYGRQVCDCRELAKLFHLIYKAEDTELNGYANLPGLPLVIYSSIASSGIAAGEKAESFFQPSFWSLQDDFINEPAFLNVALLGSRIREDAKQMLLNIFDEKSAEILIAAVCENAALESFLTYEYLLHELGHFKGISVSEKSSQGLLKHRQSAAIEEWRADGLEFSALNFFNSDLKLGIIATNLILRFAIEAHRLKGLKEVDVLTSLMTFDSFLRSESILVAGNKLTLAENNLACLEKGAEAMISETRLISQRELNIFNENLSPQRVAQLYLDSCNLIRPSEDSSDKFKKYIINPCKDIRPVWLR